MPTSTTSTNPSLVAAVILLRLRRTPPSEWENPEPSRFAQAVGLSFTLVGLRALSRLAPADRVSHPSTHRFQIKPGATT